MKRAGRDVVKSRLSRIAGQVAGLQKMVEENRNCIDILTQLAAVRSALDATGVELLTDHLTHCVVRHSEEPPHPESKDKSSEQLIAEVKQTLGRFLR
jgi:DNA-binding FrmR family transcriptional regulator